MKTLQIRYGEALKDLGFREDQNPQTYKYRVYIHPQMPVKFFLGRSGAVRFGRISTESRALSERGKEMLMARELPLRKRSGR